MLRHIFQMIWNQRRSNAWIFFETVLIFSILWFCSDYLFYMGSRYAEPIGFDISHTYKIKMEGKTQAEITVPKEEWMSGYDRMTTILERIKRHPAVESVGVSNMAEPYGGSTSAGTALVENLSDSSVDESAFRSFISAGFLDVFRLNVQGNLANWDNSTPEQAILIGLNKENLFKRYPPDQVKTIKEGSGEVPVVPVVGVMERTKRNDGMEYGNHIFSPIIKSSQYASWADISVRVHPDQDKGFAERFMKDMKDQLDIDTHRLAEVQSYKDIRKELLARYYGEMNGVYAITGFLLVNIFLGMIGTFWFRTQSRRGEIGLRMALGASKKKVRRMMVFETLLIVFLASVLGTIISLNLAKADILSDLGVPLIDREDLFVLKAQDVINFALTFGTLALVSVIAVLYPANQAARTQPAETLHDE